MVGLALVSAIAVFGASASKSATASVDQAISADILVTASSGGLSNSVPAILSTVPGVTREATVYRGQFEFDHSVDTITGPRQHTSETRLSCV